MSPPAGNGRATPLPPAVPGIAGLVLTHEQSIIS